MINSNLQVISVTFIEKLEIERITQKIDYILREGIFINFETFTKADAAQR